MNHQLLAVAIVCLFAGNSALFATNTENTAELATSWNRTVLELAEAEDGFLTLKGLRTATMMHIAMHDALNSVQSDYQTYVFDQPNVHADPVAAATEAAFAITMDQYPDNKALLKGLRNHWLGTLPGGNGLTQGIELGRAVAKAILESRIGDGWDTEAEYRWHPMAPGVYAEFAEHSATPEGFIFGSGWGKAKGFALESAGQFRAPPPPEINSEAYTRAYNEVKEVGRFQALSRTPDQSHLAMWWKDFAENSHNRLARDLIQKERIDLVDANRLLALINMSIFDAYVSSFENKFLYNHWRPYTAIRWAANDGNPDTEPEETWTNTHRHTYAFPSYPSAHGTACGAAMTAFASVLGDEYEFTMRIPRVDVAGPFSGKIEMRPPTRDFVRFSDAAMECAMSRVYLGIHFRYDSVEGFNLGRQVGENVVKHVLVKN